MNNTLQPKPYTLITTPPTHTPYTIIHTPYTIIHTPYTPIHTPYTIILIPWAFHLVVTILDCFTNGSFNG